MRGSSPLTFLFSGTHQPDWQDEGLPFLEPGSVRGQKHHEIDYCKTHEERVVEHKSRSIAGCNINASSSFDMCWNSAQSAFLNTDWWFGTFFVFPYIGNNRPNWRIFSRRVETTNQNIIMYSYFLTWTVCENRSVLSGSKQFGESAHDWWSVITNFHRYIWLHNGSLVAPMGGHQSFLTAWSSCLPQFSAHVSGVLGATLIKLVISNILYNIPESCLTLSYYIYIILYCNILNNIISYHIISYHIVFYYAN